MNALCYKIVFSKRLGALVAVGEHTAGQGKAAGTGVRTAVYPSSAVGATAGEFVGSLKAVFASVALTCFTATTIAAGPATNTLPTGYSVNSGNVAISTNGATMNINQSTDKASVNWNSFSIGSGAAVNVQQNSASSVLLNRVVGNDPSQIFGKLTANGQVILINPNGVVFGKRGSVTASTFTASTFGMTDADFQAGKQKFSRNGSTAGVTVEEGAHIDTTGYVALIGASVDNQGVITTKGGSVVLASGEEVGLPSELTDNISVPLSGKVRLELLPSIINAMVTNSGTITTEGGQVLMQAADVADAVASVTHTGNIDTTSEQGGAVTLLADHGNIKVTGKIKANSTAEGKTGGDIVIGRDEKTGVLAKAADVSGAKLESGKGFVETSGELLKIDGIQVKANEWLLDPNDIIIDGASTSGTGIANAQTLNGVSHINATDLGNALTTGTSVTVQTLASATGGNGDITVNTAVTALGNGTLKLQADRNLAINANIDTKGGDTQLQTKGGQITLGNNVVVKGNNISLDTTNGTIGTDGAITAGGSSTSANAITLNTGSKLLATNNLNLRAKANGNFNALTLSGTLQAKTITGDLTSAGGVSVNMNGAEIITLAGGGNSELRGIHTATSGPGSFVAGTNKITAASGTTFKFTSNSSTVGSVSYGKSRGLRIEAGTITTNGAVTIEGKSGSSDGLLLINSGGLINTGGTLTVLGSTTGNGGGGVGGISTSAGGFIKATTNTAHVKITGYTANQNATLNEAGIWLQGAGAISGAGGTLEMTGYSSSGKDSAGMTLANGAGAGITGWGSAKIVGQNLRTSAGNAVTIAAAVNLASNAVTIQSIGGRVQQSGAITAGQLTIDNTGAGLKSLITDAGVILSPGVILNRDDAMGGAINSAGEVTAKGIGKSNSGQHGLNLQGVINSSGTTYLSGETSAANGGSVKGISLDGQTNATGGLTVDSVSDSRVAGVITGGTSNAGGLIKKGTSILELGNANTFRGVTLVKEGTLALNNVNALQMSTLDTGTSGAQQVTFTLASPTTYNIGALGLVGPGSGTPVYGADDLNIGANTISLGANNNSTYYTGVISGSGNLIKTGTGTQKFTGANSYSGTTTINAGGALQLGIGTGGGTSGSIENSAIVNNGTLIINRSDAFSLSQSLTGTGGLQQSGTGTTTLTLPGNGYTGETKVNAGTLVTTTMDKFKSSTINIASDATFEAKVDTNTFYTGTTTVSGTGTFKKTGAKGLTLSSGTAKMTFGSDFKGLLNIQAGAIQNDNLVNALIANASTINIASGAVLDIRGEAVQMKGLTGEGNIINSWNGVYNNSAGNTTSGIVLPNTLTFGVGASASDTFTYSGVIGAAVTTSNISNLPAVASQPANLANGAASKPISVAKSGDGTQILSGTNTYSGTTAVNGGTLQIGAAGDSGTLGAGAVTLAGGTSNLKFVRTIDTTISNEISGAGNVSANITSKDNTAGKLTVTSSNFKLTNGLIDLRADGDVTLNTSIGTTSAANGTGSTKTAVTLVAGQAINAGDSSGGNVNITGSNNITVGTGGVAAIYSGSIDQTNVPNGMVPNGSGKFRYNSDESTTNYTKALKVKGGTDTGVNIIYREAPTVEVTAYSDTSGNLKYNGNTQTGTQSISYSGLQNGDTSALFDATNLQYAYNSGSPSPKNAGTYTTSASGLTDKLGYGITYKTGTLVIAKKDVNLDSITAAGKTYDGNNTASITGVTLKSTDLVGSETLIATAVGTFDSKNAGNRTATVTAANTTLADGTNDGLASNYNVVGTKTATATIAKKDVNLDSITAAGKTYDGNNTASITGVTLKSTDLVGSETLIATAVGTFDSKNAGNRTATVTAANTTLADGTNDGLASNYNVVGTKTATATIAKKDVNLDSITAAGKTYDGNNTASITGVTLKSTDLVGSETLIATAVGTFDSKNAGNRTATVTAANTTLADGTNDGLASNYNVVGTKTATATIAKKDVNLDSITAAGKTYDGNNTASITGVTLKSTDLVGSETLIATAVGTFDSKNAGNRTATVTAANTTLADGTNDGLASNYNVVGTKTATATIAKKDVNLDSITAAGKTYDGNNTASITGVTLKSTDLVGSETLIATAVGTFDSKNAGNRTATVTAANTTLADGTNDGLASNYNVVGTKTATATIAKKDVNLDSITAAGKTYDGNNTASITGVTLKSTDLVGSETLIATAVGTFDSKNAGNRTATVTAANTTLADGTNDGLASNYNVVGTKTATATIAKKDVNLDSITAAGKTYDGNNTASITGVTLKSTDLVGSETLIATAVGTFDSKNAGNRTATVTAANTTLADGTNDGLASNYNVVGTKTATATIDKKDATIKGTTTTKTYNASAQTQDAAALEGFIDSDVTNRTVSATGLASGRNAGTYTSDLKVTGDDAGNYNVKVTNADLVVQRKTLTALYKEANKVFDGSALATVGATPSEFGVIGNDDVKISQTANYDTPNVGANKTVNVNNITLSGADSNNYTVKSTATTKGAITAVPPVPPKPVVPNGNAPAKVPVTPANPFALASAEELSDDVCSANSVENCHCEASPLSADVGICYEPKAGTKGNSR